MSNNTNEANLVIIRNLIKDYSTIKVIEYNERNSSYAARNYGVEKSKYNQLQFIDIDCLLQEDYLVNSFKLNESEYFIVAGEIKLFNHNKVDNIYESYDKLLFLNQKAYARKKTCATANLITNKLTFHRIGGFPIIASGSDIEFCKKFQTVSKHFLFVDNIIVNHPTRCSYDCIRTKMAKNR